MEQSTISGSPVYTPDTIVRIYGLIDPRTGLLRYVGRTKKKLAGRLYLHIKDAKRNRDKPNHRLRWLRKLLSLSLRPTIVLIEECRGDGVAEERFHIRFAMADDLPLVNSNDGGQGPTWISDELRERMRKAKLGTRHTPEAKAKCSEASRKRWASASDYDRDQIRKLGYANRHRVWTETSRKKLSAAHRGRKLSPAHCQALSAARKGKPWTEKRRASPVTNKGFKFSEASRLRLSKAKKGKRPGNCRFTLAEEQIIIGKYIAAGHCSATKALAAEYGVSFQLISDILRRNKVPLHKHSLRPEQIEKMRQSKIGSKQSPEVVEKRISKIRGIKRRPFTEEHRRKMSEAHKGHKQTPEVVAKRTAATLATKAKKKTADPSLFA